MDSLVPAQITSELTQILSNLILGDNAIRSAAEKAVDERLAQTPDVYVTALAETAVGNEKEVMRSFALVLLRRLLFRSRGHVPSQQQPTGGPANSTQAAVRAQHLAEMALYDHLSLQTLQTLERLLLHSLTHERSYSVRTKCVDTICDVANQSMKRGRPWHDLQALGFQMTQQAAGEQDWQLRESSFKVFAGAPNLVMDLQSDAVLSLFAKGLGDSHISVRLAALQASVAYLTAAEPSQLAAAAVLMSPILQTLPAAASSSNALSTPSATSPPPSALNTSNYSSAPTLATFITSLTPLATSHPTLFAPQLPNLVNFLPGLVLPPMGDEGVTPTVARPLGGAPRATGTRPHRSFTFPPPTPPTTTPLSTGPGRHGLNLNTSFSISTANTHTNTHSHDDDETAKELRLTALEFMLSLSEAKPSMVKRVDGWVGVVVRACLEGMGEFDEDETGSELREWLNEDPSVSSSDTDSTPSLYEQSLDRLACALGGKAILPPAFQYIPSMLASYDWRSRHAGLLAIAAIAEGTGKVMQKELGKVVDLVTPLFKDTHPRVRYAACQCVGQLCTDLEETIQESYHQQLFSGLIPTLEDPEPRVHAHAASALINFCEGVERDTLLPYLDIIVERLLRLLSPPQEEGKPPRQVRKYVQEQVITTLAMVADASETSFTKYYSTIMPLLLNVLQNADGVEYKKLRIKAMECAGLIAIAVGRDMFRPDANSFAECLIRLQKAPPDASDPQLPHYLMATWAKLCQAMGPEFEPYLPFVMPSLLTSASAKADVTVYDEEPTPEASEGWETINMDGHLVGVRTSGIEEKCQAFETMVIYASTLGGKYAPYLAQSLEVTLPQLCFHFHDGVREACAMLIPMLLSSGKQSNTLTAEMVAATLVQLIRCIADEHDPSFLASMIKSFSDSLVVITGSSSSSGGHTLSSGSCDWRLPAEYHNGILEATKRQLQNIAERRRTRATNGVQDEEDKEDLVLYEEMEEFALEEMARMVRVLDAHTQAQLQPPDQGNQNQLKQWHEQQQQMLIAVSSVKELGISRYESDDDAA